ncbi:MAG: SGNH/GDSL hydrolase family protein [Desulfobacterales bacterium]|jgi:thermolabile hemolysin
METTVKKIMKAFLALPFLVLCATNGFAAAFDEIVVFGDSLSDNGNLVFIENQPEPDPELYYQGRFSNGPVWVEYLADLPRLNAPLTDRAIGGAQSGGFIGLNVQVPAYIAAADPPSPNALFIIWIGGNDFLNGDGDFQAAVANINEALEELLEFGALHLLVLNLPDLGAIPATLGKPEAPQATAFTTNFNAELAVMLDNFRVEHPQIGVYEFDVFAFATAVQSDPAAYGFINVTDPSPNFEIPNNFDGAGYVFWDERHPTTGMHALIADQVFAALNAQAPAPGANNAVQQDSDDSTCFIRSSMW